MNFTEKQVSDYARDAYLNGNAGFDIEPGKCVLLVIDMQDEFVKPGLTPYWVPAATEAIPLIGKLIGHCREIDIPVLHTLFSNTYQYYDRPFSGQFMPNRYIHPDIDQSGYFVNSRICAELSPAEDEIVIQKPSYGAFYDTPLETILKNMGKNTVIISGTLTNFCCGATARQAYERGFKVIFGSDITATNDAEAHEHELRVLRAGFAKVMSSKEIATCVDLRN